MSGLLGLLTTGGKLPFELLDLAGGIGGWFMERLMKSSKRLLAESQMLQ